MSILELLQDENFNKILLSVLTGVVSIAVKYLKDVSVSLAVLSKDVNSLNRELAVIVHQIQLHEKRLDNIEDRLS